jgi:non-heme Fe2+,alpha-ketoglutarate-dependent halogenase
MRILQELAKVYSVSRMLRLRTVRIRRLSALLPEMLHSAPVSKANMLSTGGHGLLQRTLNRFFVAGRAARRPGGIFSPTSERHVPGLSGDEMAQFERDGWVGTFPLLTAEGVKCVFRCQQKVGPHFAWRDLGTSAGDSEAFVKRPWPKSMHAYVPTFYEVASHPAIVSRMQSILGPDIIAWGVSTAIRQPGQTHRWHVDVEHHRWPGVSVFLGLTNISPESTLKVVSRSHRIDALPQTIGVSNDEAALAAARRYDPRSELVTVDMSEGEFFIFHGRLWHGSHNGSRHVRMALIAQYSRPDAEIAIPLNWDGPIQWHPYRPPCVLVRGSDQAGVNRIVRPPTDWRPLPAPDFTSS